MPQSPQQPQPPQPPQPPPPPRCRKKPFLSRKFAKLTLRKYQGMGLNGAKGPVRVYPCPICSTPSQPVWHIGHHGNRSRAQMRKDASQ